METTTKNMQQPTTKTNLIYKKGLVIAGPCSAESEEQLLKTAIELAEIGKVDMLRAGIWKPRTNPGGFEGIGTKGLPWLLKAKQVTGLKTAIEVATAKHVEDALSFDVDVLWIGARTTVNPFSVQQIADALKGTKQTVLIKNPVNPDIKLWIGAIERLRNVGIDDIGLIHRGFTSYGNTEYRNVPMWQIPIEMKRLFPEIPLICDPSHICGNRTGLLAVAQKSVDLDYDGLIIESHCTPDSALTDKQQQIAPAVLNELLKNIVRKTNSSNEEEFVKQLNHLREQINHLDEELLSLISNRMNVAKQIGEIKKSSNITVLQSSRYNEIVERAINKGTQVGLSDEFIKAYLEAIHTESIRIQNKVNGINS
jgi:chorismate mutase